MKESTRDNKIYTGLIQMNLTKNFTISTREGIQETSMQFLNSKITLSWRHPFKKCANCNAPNNYTQLPQSQW